MRESMAEKANQFSLAKRATKQQNKRRKLRIIQWNYLVILQF